MRRHTFVRANGAANNNAVIVFHAKGEMFQ